MEVLILGVVLVVCREQSWSTKEPDQTGKSESRVTEEVSCVEDCPPVVVVGTSGVVVGPTIVVEMLGVV